MRASWTSVMLYWTTLSENPWISVWHTTTSRAQILQWKHWRSLCHRAWWIWSWASKVVFGSQMYLSKHWPHELARWSCKNYISTSLVARTWVMQAGLRVRGFGGRTVDLDCQSSGRMPTSTLLWALWILWLECVCCVCVCHIIQINTIYWLILNCWGWGANSNTSKRLKGTYFHLSGLHAVQQLFTKHIEAFWVHRRASLVGRCASEVDPRWVGASLGWLRSSSQPRYFSTAGELTCVPSQLQRKLQGNRSQSELSKPHRFPGIQGENFIQYIYRLIWDLIRTDLTLSLLFPQHCKTRQLPNGRMSEKNTTTAKRQGVWKKSCVLQSQFRVTCDARCHLQHLSNWGFARSPD